VRGGNGYIEDWVNSRLIRDAHIGVLWEGTSNINALDVINRAVAKSGGHQALARALKARLQDAEAAPADFRAEIAELIDRAVAFAAQVAAKPRNERFARIATDALYNSASAALMTWEGATTGANGGDARRMIMSRMVVEHRLRPEDPLALPASDWEEDATTALLDPSAVSLERAAKLVTA
jgi:Acyl-CoA dehydrogenase, C-terminal domain